MASRDGEADVHVLGSEGQKWMLARVREKDKERECVRPRGWM